MTLQPAQQVFNGVVVGFAMIVDGVQPTGPSRREYDTRYEMMVAYNRLQSGAFKDGWDAPISAEFRVRFKTETGEEEEVDLNQYHVPHLSKGDPANKILCKCGAVAWRIGKAELFANMLFVCNDCRDVKVDADPRI